MHKRFLLFFNLLVLTFNFGCQPAPVQAPAPPSLEATEVLAPRAATTELVDVPVYFFDENRFTSGAQPFETAVIRQVEVYSPTGGDLPGKVLEELFRGPTPEEQQTGLRLVDSGFNGFSQLRIEGGVAHVYLTGTCQSGGSTYTIAQLLLKNLLQFPEIQSVKIYDASGTTEEPEGATNSIPFCLEP